MNNTAIVTFMRNGHVHTESVIGFWKILWAPHHVVIYNGPDNDENIFVAYRASDVIEVCSEKYED